MKQSQDANAGSLHADATMCQSCHKQPATPDHTCPYKEDINNDSETMFGGVFSKIQMMTPSEQVLVDVAECPICRQHEGRAEKMRLLLKCEAFTGYQCNRCKNVWVTNTPNADIRQAGPDVSK